MRRRILLLVVGMTTLVIIAFAIPMALLIRSSVVQHNRDQTQNQARAVAQNIRILSKAQITTYVANISDATGRATSVQIFGANGKTTRIGKTPADAVNRPNRPGGAGGPGDIQPSDPSVPTGSNGGGTGGGPLTQLVGAPGGQVAFAGGLLSSAEFSDEFFVVRVYLSEDAKYAGESGKFLLLGGAALALIILGAIAGEILTRRITRPLVETAHTAQQLSHGDTMARAPTDGPTEVADVGRALNRLADRIDQLIAEERETVADLSHRLRTPLTALRLDAEALHDPTDAERVGSHVTDLERTLTAVIHAARRPQREGRMPSCDAREIVRERIGFWSALTDDQGRRSAVVLPDEPLPVRTSAEDLAAAIDALLENVIAHTPEGTDFAVTLTATATGARLTVSDEGPGLPEQPPVRGRSDRGSSGLGLDIARRCAEASGGSMTLGTSPTGGALITLELVAP